MSRSFMIEGPGAFLNWSFAEQQNVVWKNNIRNPPTRPALQKLGWKASHKSLCHMNK